MLKVLFKEPSGWIGRLILKITGGKYSHCEIAISAPPWHGDMGFVYSADYKGVSLRLVTGEYLSKFTVVDLSHCVDKYDLDLKAGAIFLDKQVGKSYDWANMFLSKLIPFNADKKSRWICSELVTAALQKCRLPVTNRPKDVTPRRLYDVLVDWFMK
jgi:hypothetical protein